MWETQNSSVSSETSLLQVLDATKIIQILTKHVFLSTPRDADHICPDSHFITEAMRKAMENKTQSLLIKLNSHMFGILQQYP